MSVVEIEFPAFKVGSRARRLDLGNGCFGRRRPKLLPAKGLEWMAICSHRGLEMEAETPPTARDLGSLIPCWQGLLVVLGSRFCRVARAIDIGSTEEAPSHVTAQLRL